MTQDREPQPLPGLVAQALETLGYRVGWVAPELLRAEPPGEGRRRALLVACDPVWLARAPGVTLTAPGSDGARRLWQEVAERGRRAVFVEGLPGHAGRLQRSLWFRWLLVVTGFALAEGARRFVIDVRVTTEPERAEPMEPHQAAAWATPGRSQEARRAAAALGWVAPYEAARLGRLAARVALRVARTHVEAIERELGPVREAERRRLERYFDDRRAEETARMGRWLHRALAAELYARLAADPELARQLQSRAGEMARLARLQQQTLESRLASLERERAAALAEAEARFALRAELVPAGMAVVWHPAP